MYTDADLHFAIVALKFRVAHGSNPEKRAKAKIMVAAIDMFDVRMPDWKKTLLQKLNEEGITREPADLFALDDVDHKAMLDRFMFNALRKE